jgi:hypothetical protein
MTEKKIDSMKILRFYAENVLKLKAVEIVPKDNMVEIRGKNASGKSSILDSIVMALTGGKSIPEKPINKGADKGKIIIELPMYKITRSFTKDNSYLAIEAVDGSKIKSPQKFLDDLVGSISFDPLDFINKTEQRRVVLELIGVDVDALDKEEKELREQRTIIGRDVKTAKATLDGLTFDQEVGSDSEEVSITDIAGKMNKDMEFNVEWDRKNTENEDRKNEAKANRKKIDECRDEILRLELVNNGLKLDYENVFAELSEEPKRDISDIQSQIAVAEDKNRKIRSNKLYLEAKEKHADQTKLYDTKTSEIETVEKKRKISLEGAKMPVAGLTFDENGLLYDGIPLAQASDGQKLMIGLQISMALNPTLRVLRIKDGSLLDNDNRAIIREIIKDQDFQLWMESVSDDKNVGIFIEDGGVVAIDGKAQVKPKEVKKQATAVKEEVPVSTKPVPEVPDDW